MVFQFATFFCDKVLTFTDRTDRGRLHNTAGKLANVRFSDRHNAGLDLDCGGSEEAEDASRLVLHRTEFPDRLRFRLSAFSDVA